MENKFKTPILFLTYNKHDTTMHVFNQIKKVNPKNLIIASDGAKNKSDEIIINNLRNSFNEDLKDIKFHKIYNDENLGCKSAVTNAINKCFELYSELIILEDDTLPSPSFFKYSEKVLDLYSGVSNINLISGYNYLIKSNGRNSYNFSKYSNIWGWATWKSQWEDQVELNQTNLKKFMKRDLSSTFYSEVEKDYYLERFHDVVYNNLDSWAFGLTFSNFYQNKLSTIPKFNLVKNIGLGHEKATHTKNHTKMLISTPNINLGMFQRHNYLKKPIKVSNKNDLKYYKKVILKNTIYNKITYKYLKLTKKN